MKKQIFFFRKCDELKRSSVTDMILIGTSKEELKDKIVSEIESGNMNYYDSNLSSQEQLSKFLDDWDNVDRNTINDRLIFGIVDYIYNSKLPEKW